MIPLVAFWGLFITRMLDADARARLRRKPLADWTLDLLGLVVQGALIPVLQVWAVAAGLALLWPSAHGALAIPAPAAFALNFVVVDYLYYWNHRALHARALWPVHVVHHGVSDMDVLGTSRNTLWSSFFIVYLWANGALVFALGDATWFAASAGITAALDLWRHSGLGPRAGSTVHRALSMVLICPVDHAWHHACETRFGNFGANLSWWDRIHGTWLGRDEAPATLGVRGPRGLGRRLLWPFGATDDDTTAGATA